MARQISLLGAKNLAERILEEAGLLELPVDIESLAQKNNIIVEEMPTELASRSVYGALLITNDTTAIFYSSLIKNLGFQRFTIAHELGHYFLDGHIDTLVDSDGLHLSDSDFCSPNLCELEADHFASSLLMPAKLCRKLIGGCDDGLTAIKALADASWSSLTAAAIRYIDFASTPSAIIVSSKGIIQYSIKNRNFFQYGTLPFKGSPLPKESLSYSVMAPEKQKLLIDNELESDISLWVGGRHSFPCLEEIVPLGSTGKLLTILTCPEKEEEDDGEVDNDNKFERHWGLRF